MYAIVLSTIVASLFSVMPLVDSTKKPEALESSSLESLADPFSITDRFQKSYTTDLIVDKMETDNISVKRGQTFEIPLTFQHLSNTSTSKDVTLTKFHNVFRSFAQSATERLDDAEFMKLISKNESARGKIEMEEVKVSPSTVTISKATTTVILTVTVPQDLPVEMSGKSITIGLIFDISPESTVIGVLVLA